MNKTHKQMTFGIMLALVLWGIYLAVGATGYFVQASMMDWRKSLVVLVCMALFLGLWSIVLRRGKPGRIEPSKSHSDQAAHSLPTARLSWSKSGISTFCLAVAGALFWLTAISSWQSVSLTTTTILGWFAALSMVGSATAGMIALSDRRSRRGKWLGVLGLIGAAGSLIGFIARMSP